MRVLARLTLPRRYSVPISRALFILCVGVASVLAPCLIAQDKTAAAAQAGHAPFDSTTSHGPAGLGAMGVVSGGDNMAFARADFDDSAWIPIDEKSTVRQVFPGRPPQVIWQRIHVKTNPNLTGMGLETYGVSQAYDVYVNGQRLIESGQVDPFIPYSEDARIVVPIPDELVKTGSLTIAIRARALPRWWQGTGASVPSFPPSMASLGQEEALRDRAWFKIVGGQAFDWILDCCGVVVCLVALALFSAQRQQYKYLWLSLLGAVSLVDLPISLVQPFRSLPINLIFARFAIDYLSALFITLMVMAFVRQKLARWVWICIAICVAAPILSDWAAENSHIPFIFYQASQIPYRIAVTVLIPVVLLMHLRRGNREAGILLVPMIFWSLATYFHVILFLVEQIPAMHARAASAMRLMSTFSIGSFVLNLGNVAALLFFLTLAAIIVRRSTRMSRQQALFEGEMAAARAVQQVILPEQIDAVPGFRVESIYEPAQQVGGDFFQILPVAENGLLMVVGDVAGKGLPAAMLVSVLVGAIRATAEYTLNPAEMLASLNARLVGRSRGGFSTALAAHIASDGCVTIANAGHLSPYLDGIELELAGALPLGVISDITYETSQFSLRPGSRLTFYSDGVVEAHNQRGELFGFDRAKEISTQPALAIVEAAKLFGQEDDITVVTIAREAAVASAA